MLTKILLVAAALSLCACVDDADPSGTRPDRAAELTTVTAPPADDSTDDFAATERENGERTDLCDLLPTDEADPCSHLCDPDGLAPYLAPHTCTTFVCHLTDGTTYLAGGCVL